MKDDSKWLLSALVLMFAFVWTWALMKQYFANIEVAYRYYPYYEVIIEKAWYYKPAWLTMVLSYATSILYCMGMGGMFDE